MISDLSKKIKKNIDVELQHLISSAAEGEDIKTVLHKLIKRCSCIALSICKDDTEAQDLLDSARDNAVVEHESIANSYQDDSELEELIDDLAECSNSISNEIDDMMDRLTILVGNSKRLDESIVNISERFRTVH